MRKLSLTLAAAGLTMSLGAFAALPTDAAPFQLVIPNLKSGVDITLEGLLLQPSNSDLDYAVSGSAVRGTRGDFDNLPVTWTSAGKANVQSIDPQYNFGFRVGLGYTFAESGNDIQVSWTRFDQNDNDDFSVPNGHALQSRLIGADFSSFPNEFEIGGTEKVSSASSSVNTKLDAIDLDVGQYVDIGTRLRMRMFGGLRFARVSSDLSTDFYSTEVNNSEGEITEVRLNEQFNSKFTGVGPRVGVDSVYHIGSCFGVVARAAVGLLVGQTETDSQFAYNATTHFREILAAEQNLSAKIDSSDSTRVVPVLDAKLGLNYSFTFENQSILTLEAGYQATQYIDAIDRLDGGFSVASISDNKNIEREANLIQGQAVRTTSGIGFSGPYLSLNWKV
ncbi:MAG: hypothetical protein K0Q74_444 [Gammaproteobacteria bacterium]|jgi:hypothetical protein|nr:hypothetical protein [Gammaproteobacteria bacterium]